MHHALSMPTPGLASGEKVAIHHMMCHRTFDTRSVCLQLLYPLKFIVTVIYLLKQYESTETEVSDYFFLNLRLRCITKLLLNPWRHSDKLSAAA